MCPFGMTMIKYFRDLLPWCGAHVSGAGEPNGGTAENCAQIWDAGGWNDAGCGNTCKFVCEKPSKGKLVQHIIRPVQSTAF